MSPPQNAGSKPRAHVRGVCMYSTSKETRRRVILKRTELQVAGFLISVHKLPLQHIILFNYSYFVCRFFFFFYTDKAILTGCMDRWMVTIGLSLSSAQWLQ